MTFKIKYIKNLTYLLFYPFNLSYTRSDANEEIFCYFLLNFLFINFFLIKLLDD